MEHHWLDREGDRNYCMLFTAKWPVFINDAGLTGAAFFFFTY